VWSQALDSMILVGPFQLGILYDSVILCLLPWRKVEGACTKCDYLHRDLGFRHPIFSAPQVIHAVTEAVRGREETSSCCKEGACTAGDGREGAAPSHCLPMSLLPAVVPASSSFSVPTAPPVHDHSPHPTCRVPSSALQKPPGDGDSSGDISLSAAPKEQLRKALVQSVSREKRRDILRFVTKLFMSQFKAVEAQSPVQIQPLC